MTFTEIFAEYYTLYRGQATNIPVYGDPEFTIGVNLANNAIRKWDRVDGMLWSELVSQASDQSLTVFPAVANTISNTTVTYAAPTNMRKPPKEVWVYNNGNYQKINVVEARYMSGLSKLANQAAFLGDPNSGYTMHITQPMADNYHGWNIDYIYWKKPTLFSTDVDPAAEQPEMSDPNFIIQDALASRAATVRNGFVFNTARSEAKAALVNMKIENESGVYGASHDVPFSSQFGVNQPPHDIELGD